MLSIFVYTILPFLSVSAIKSLISTCIDMDFSLFRMRGSVIFVVLNLEGDLVSIWKRKYWSPYDLRFFFYFLFSNYYKYVTLFPVFKGFCKKLWIGVCCFHQFVKKDIFVMINYSSGLYNRTICTILPLHLILVPTYLLGLEKYNTVFLNYRD